MTNTRDRARARWRRPALALLGAALTINCERAPNDETESTGESAITVANLSIALPETLTPEQVALGASRSLVISTSDQVMEPFAGASTVTNTGTQQSTVSSSSTVGDLWSNAPVLLGPKAKIDGSIFTVRALTRDPSAIVTGNVVPKSVVTAPILTTWQVPFPTTNKGDKTIASGTTTTLAPGRYNNVKVAGTLALSHGDYFFTTLVNQSGGHVNLNMSGGAIRVFVLTTLTSEGPVVVKKGDAANFFVGFTGTNPAFIRSPFSGTVVAPNAKVTVAPGAPSATNFHTGSFFAKDVEVSPGTTIKHAAFHGWGSFTAPGSVCNDPALASKLPSGTSLTDFFSLCPNLQPPHLDPPISKDDSKKIRDGFSWPATKPVPNFGAEGNPTLYYALVYVQDRADLEALDDLRIHWDTLPFFAEERAKWAGQIGTLSPAFDDEGAFVFAIIPGVTYNLIREAALCPDPANAQEPFRAIVLRDVPNPDAKDADGSLSYRFLAQEGFRYRGLPNCPDSEMDTAAGDDEAVCDPAVMMPPPGGDPEINALLAAKDGSGLAAACAPPDMSGGQPFGLGLGKLIKRLAKSVVSVTKKVEDLARNGLSRVSRFFKGSAKLTVALQLRNTDPGFGGQSTTMTRAWGAHRGEAIPLEGVQIRALQQITFSFRVKIPSVKIGEFHTPNIITPKVSGTIPFDALSTATAHADGTATMKVVKHSNTSICVKAANSAGVIYDWIFPQEACSFQNPLVTADKLNGDMSITAPFQDRNLNVLAQITDAHAYLRDVVHYTPKTAEVMTGRFANLFSSADGEGDKRPYSPCFGYPNWRNPYGAILGALFQDAVHDFTKEKIEPLLRKGAQIASESLDKWSDASLRWAEAKAQAAGTAAAMIVNQAADAAQAARDAAFTAQQQAVKAAQAASDLTEAARRLSTLKTRNAPANAIAAAGTAVTNAVNAVKAATDLAKQATDTAKQAADSAKQLADNAEAVVANTTAAAAGVIAAAATRAAAGLVQATVEALARSLAAILPVVGRAAGEILGEVLSDALDLVLADVDIVMPSSGRSPLSRGVTTHEYGHFALCDMTYRTSPLQFGSAWTEAIASTVAKQALKDDQTFDQEAFINEGFADFIAAQVAGGVNYFEPQTSFKQDFVTTDAMGKTVVVWAEKMSWCNNGPDARCIEDNFGAVDPLATTFPAVPPVIPGTMALKQVKDDTKAVGYNRQVARIASTLHDAFDGQPISPAADIPGNGVAWTQAPLVMGTQPVVVNAMGSLNQCTANDSLQSPALHEETVTLPGTALPRVIDRWLSGEGSPIAHLQERTFFGGLSQTMFENGVAASEACRLYVNHQPGDDCPAFTCPLGQTFDPPTSTCKSDVIIK